jgi:hypothetical protein
VWAGPVGFLVDTSDLQASEAAWNKVFRSEGEWWAGKQARERHQDDQYSSLWRRRRTYAMLACVFTFGEAHPMV